MKECIRVGLIGVGVGVGAAVVVGGGGEERTGRGGGRGDVSKRHSYTGDRIGELVRGGIGLVGVWGGVRGGWGDCGGRGVCCVCAVRGRHRCWSGLVVR